MNRIFCRYCKHLFDGLRGHQLYCSEECHHEATLKRAREEIVRLRAVFRNACAPQFFGLYVRIAKGSRRRRIMGRDTSTRREWEICQCCESDVVAVVEILLEEMGKLRSGMGKRVAKASPEVHADVAG